MLFQRKKTLENAVHNNVRLIAVVSKTENVKFLQYINVRAIAVD